MIYNLILVLPLVTIFGCSNVKFTTQDASHCTDRNSKTERASSYAKRAPVATGFSPRCQEAETISFTKSSASVQASDQSEAVPSAPTGFQAEAKYIPKIQETTSIQANQFRPWCAFHRSFIMSEAFTEASDIVPYWYCRKRSAAQPRKGR